MTTEKDAESVYNETAPSVHLRLKSPILPEWVHCEAGTPTEFYKYFVKKIFKSNGDTHTKGKTGVCVGGVVLI